MCSPANLEYDTPRDMDMDAIDAWRHSRRRFVPKSRVLLEVKRDKVIACYSNMIQHQNPTVCISLTLKLVMLVQDRTTELQKGFMSGALTQKALSRLRV